MWQFCPYAPPLILTSLLAFSVSFYAFRRGRSVPRAREFGYLSLAAGVWAACAAGDLSSTTIEAKLMWLRVEYVAFTYFPTGAFVFASRSTDRDSWVTPRRVFLIGIIPFVTLVLAWTNEYHWLVQSPSVLVPRDGFVMRHAEGRIVFWIFVLHAYACMFVANLLYAREAIFGTRIARRQGLALLLGSLFPWSANLVYLAGWSPDPDLDLTPIAYTATVVSWAWVVTRERLFDLIPVARSIVFEKMLDPVLVLDERDRVLDANPAAERLLGATVAGLVGRPLGEVAPDLVRGHEVAIGGQFFEKREAPIVTPSTSGRVIALRDVTVRRETELAQARAVMDAESAARERAEFIARMSHEIRTPLYGVIGSADLLAREPLHESAMRWVEAMRGSSRGLLALVDEILDFSRLDAKRVELERVAFVPIAVVEELLGTFEALALERGIWLRADFVDELPRLVGDPHRLRQILANLVSNALKFTERGEIVVRVALESEFGDSLGVRFSVSDTGVGIASEALEHVFHAFRQANESTARRYGGTGLGLAISDRLVRLMGGRLEVESTQGVGSTFHVRVTFDRARESEPGVARTSDLRVRAGHGARALVVDDHPINRLVSESLLRDLGFEVMTASTGSAAIELASNEAFELVLLDLHMPGLDGRATARELRAHGFTKSIVMFTAHVAAANEDALEGVVDAWLPKPFTGADLRSVFRVCMPGLLLDAVHETDAVPIGPMRAVIDAYLIRASREITTIVRAASARDWDELASTAHDLAGSSGLVGAHRTARVAAEVERRARAAEVSTAVDELESAYTSDALRLTGVRRRVVGESAEARSASVN